jgi:hypothetical protein
MTDQPVDGAQPDEGQGTPATDAPYAEYLNRIPEQVRGDVEPVFKDWDANVTRKFQEHSEYRKGWEPYEQIGVNQFSPDEVSWALQFRQALENPQAIQQWYEAYAQQNGLTVEQAQAETAQFLDGSYQDPDTANLIQKQLEQALGPIQQQLEQITGWREQQELAAREQQAMRMIEGQINELKARHGDEFNEKAVEQLVAQYIDTDPQNAVSRAWADYQALVNQISAGVLKSKAQAPSTPETGGAADGAPEPIRSLADANRIALEQIRQARIA